MAEAIGALEGKVAIVTGSGQGIGAAIAERFGEEGASVVLAEFSDKAGEETEARLVAKGINAVYMRTDVGDQTSVQAVVGQTVDRFGKLDVMVNNAGITRDKSLLGMTDAMWHDVIRVHLDGAFYGTQAAARSMAELDISGSIINASSISALNGNKGQTNYTAAKAGIVALTQTAARELGPKGIRVNAVMPGLTDTEMAAGMTPEARQAMENKIPMGRLAMPSEVAAAYLFLASDQASYVTGAVLQVDGGLVI